MGRCIRVAGRQLIVDGKAVVFKGVNLGSWINIEDFMIGLSGTDWQIRAAFKRQFGDEVAARFFAGYHEHFISEKDIRAIHDMGFTLVRVPFNYRYFESDGNPFAYCESGFAHLDRLFDWCDQRDVFAMLDFHAAPGGQNTTPPSDSTTGYSQLWLVKHFQDRVVALWEEMARRYKGRRSLMGYNLLNEPITGMDGEQTREEQIASMNRLNRRMIEAIQAIDPDHVIVIEGDVRPSGGFSTLDPALFTAYSNTMPTYHHYPMAAFEHSTNFEKEQAAGDDPEQLAAFIEEQIRGELAFSAQVDRPLLLGEFGMGHGGGGERSRAMAAAQLMVAHKYGHSWTLWPYKAVNGGLMRPAGNQPWPRFVNGPDKLGAVQKSQNSRVKHFDEVYIANFGKNEQNRLIYDAAWNDELRGLRRIALEYEVRLLSRYPVEEILAMPESFNFDNCVRADESYGILKRFL